MPSRLEEWGVLAFTDIISARRSARAKRSSSHATCFPPIVTAQHYIERLAPAGFKVQRQDDLSLEWRQILVDRLQMYRSLRETTVERFGEAHFEKWDRMAARLSACLSRQARRDANRGASHMRSGSGHEKRVSRLVATNHAQLLQQCANVGVAAGPEFVFRDRPPPSSTRVRSFERRSHECRTQRRRARQSTIQRAIESRFRCLARHGDARAMDVWTRGARRGDRQADARPPEGGSIFLRGPARVARSIILASISRSSAHPSSHLPGRRRIPCRMSAASRLRSSRWETAASSR